jgi:biotin transport system substrate-specific component
MKTATLTRVLPNARAQQVALVVGASLLISICARVSLPLPFTPVPLTLANFAVLAVGLVLGARAGAAACGLYLAYGAAGLPVFSPAGPGGLAQLLGPTGGYLLAYPAVAYVAGLLAGRSRSFGRLALAATAAEVVLFAAGVAWLTLGFGLAQAAAFGLYPFFFGEVIKVMAAAGIASRWNLRKG